MDRRRFLKTVAGGVCLCGMSGAAGPGFRATGLPRAQASTGEPASPPEHEVLHEALHYNKLEHKEIECVLCPRKCHVGDQERGYCGVRENQGGTYYTLVYGQPCSLQADPIEKKPFYHVRPQSLAFSLATPGCNMNCKYCQNWEISQVRPEQVRSIPMSPEACVAHAGRSGCQSMAYTYTEPVIFWEYMHDIAVRARKAGILNAMISAGYVEEKPLLDLLPLLDAVKIDLKSFSDSFYHEVCRGRLDPVLRSLRLIRRAGVWLEIVYLVVPTLNDDPDEMRRLCRWIHEELGPDVPLHLTRFHPTYLLQSLPSTPVSTLDTLYRLARAEGLRYVYVGNVPGHPAECTYCPECGTRLVRRSGYNVRVEALEKGKCRVCGIRIPGLWGEGA